MNGSKIATLAFKDGPDWIPCMSLMYFRSHHARLYVAALPVRAMVENDWCYGNFVACDKVPEPPYLEGDVAVKVGKTKVRLGRLITFDSPDGGKSGYMLKLNALPVEKAVGLVLENKAFYLDVELGE